MANINEEGFLELSGVNHKVFQDTLNAERFPILKTLTPLSLRVLNQASRLIHVAKGVEMMHTGDTPHDLYFINKGSVVIGKESGGKMKVVAQLTAGDFYGEYGALRGKTRFASVYTAEPSEIVRVDLKAVQQVFDADTNFKEEVYQVMIVRMLNSFLFGHPALNTLTPVARDALAKELQVMELEMGDYVFKAGDAADAYYIIISGEAEVVVENDKIKTVIEIRRDNDALGEVRQNDGKEYAYAVRAANSLDILVLDKEAIQHIQRVDAEVLPKLNQLFGQHAKKTATIIKGLST